MGFFEPPPDMPEAPTPSRAQPPWIAPPDNVLGVSVPLEPLLLARMDNVAVSLSGLVAYPTGFECALSVRRRIVEDDDNDWITKQMHARQPRRGREIPPDLFRFGVEFADKRRVTNLGWRAGFDHEQRQPEGPVLIERGGSGGDGRWEQAYWIWPLPPAGPLSFVCEWPSGGIPLTRVDVDAAPLLDASTRAVTLWETTSDPKRAGAGRSYAQFSREIST